MFYQILFFYRYQEKLYNDNSTFPWLFSEKFFDFKVLKNFLKTIQK